MSRHLHHAVEVAVPADACWAAFARVVDWPRWFPTLVRVERPEREGLLAPLRLGERLVLHLGFRGYAAPVPVRVEELGDRHVRWVGRSFGVTGDHAYRAEPIDGARSRLVSDEIFSGLPVRLLPRAIFGELDRETVAGLARFRQMVET